MITLLKSVFTHFSKSNTFEKGAALAYYTVFSFVPMIVIMVSLLGIIFGEAAVSGEMFAQMQSFLGDAGAKQMESIIENQHTNHNNTMTTIAGFATLALSATGMFTQIQNSFNTIWEVKPVPKNGIIKYLINHFSAFSILITVGFILIMSTTLSSFFYKHIDTLPTSLHIYEHVISIVLIGFAFAIMYKYLGDAEFAWKTVLVTGLFTSVLFFVGKLGIGMYIGHSKIASTFGAASVIALLMVWVYYTSQIIFLGASFAFEYGKRTENQMMS